MIAMRYGKHAFGDTCPDLSSRLMGNQDTLEYSCICEADGLSPNISEYSQTIPYFICTESNNNCVDACDSSDSACQSKCREDNACGAQDPKLLNETEDDSSSSSTTSSSADGAVYTGFGDSSSNNDDARNSASILLLDVGQILGMGVLFGTVVTGFSILL